MEAALISKPKALRFLLELRLNTAVGRNSLTATMARRMVRFPFGISRHGSAISLPNIPVRHVSRPYSLLALVVLCVVYLLSCLSFEQTRGFGSIKSSLVPLLTESSSSSISSLFFSCLQSFIHSFIQALLVTSDPCRLPLIPSRARPC
jgi:hypothetical protein